MKHAKNSGFPPLLRGISNGTLTVRKAGHVGGISTGAEWLLRAGDRDQDVAWRFCLCRAQILGSARYTLQWLARTTHARTVFLRTLLRGLIS